MMKLLLVDDLRLSIGVISVASELTISICHLVIAAAFLRSTSHPRPSYRILGLLTLLISLCGFREVYGLVEIWRITMDVGFHESLRFSLLKGVAAVFWVVTAVRLPAILERLSWPTGISYRCYRRDDRDRQADLQESEEFAEKTKELSLKTKMLRRFIHNETWLLDQFELPQELISKRDDVEMIQCPI